PEPVREPAARSLLPASAEPAPVLVDLLLDQVARSEKSKISIKGTSRAGDPCPFTFIMSGVLIRVPVASSVNGSLLGFGTEHGISIKATRRAGDPVRSPSSCSAFQFVPVASAVNGPLLGCGRRYPARVGPHH